MNISRKDIQNMLWMLRLRDLRFLQNDCDGEEIREAIREEIQRRNRILLNPQPFTDLVSIEKDPIVFEKSPYGKRDSKERIDPIPTHKISSELIKKFEIPDFQKENQCSECSWWKKMGYKDCPNCGRSL